MVSLTGEDVVDSRVSKEDVVVSSVEFANAEVMLLVVLVPLAPIFSSQMTL